ncbi:MAG TPA: hypothetical protein VE135_11385 [Pyrinomonadaceae bacterium]|nr:hypothetical protein [Pyrinomonadaceae bacterium]
MKKMINLLAIAATLSLLALPVFANRVTPFAGETLQDPCSLESKTAIYGEFYKEIKGDQAKAYEAAKKYVACPADKSDDAEAKRVQYLKDFIAKYEKARRKDQVIDFVYSKSDFPKAFEAGRLVLADDPENLRTLIALSYAGYSAAVAKNTTFSSEALGYARKAIQLLDAGKTVDNWAPFTGKDEALGYLYYTIGVLNAQNPAEALPAFIKAAQFEGKIKQLPSTYAYIAGTYEAGPYAKQSASYKSTYEGKDETPESKLALANINQVIDRMIDAYARAVALAGNDAKYQAGKTEWMEGLTTWYKYRHNQSDAGLTEMIASVLSKPLPPEPTPLTTLPASSPATSTSGTGTGQAATTTPAGTGTPATGAATNPMTNKTPAPTPKPTPAKPSNPGKPIKRNHRH